MVLSNFLQVSRVAHVFPANTILYGLSVRFVKRNSNKEAEDEIDDKDGFKRNFDIVQSEHSLILRSPGHHEPEERTPHGETQLLQHFPLQDKFTVGVEDAASRIVTLLLLV